MHPTKSIRSQKSSELGNKRIILGVTGSIAAIMSVKLSRELIRHGAEVKAVMTDSAKKIIHPYSLEYATGNKVIDEISGDVEHVREVGKNNEADLLLIAPSTANTIGKIASGIDDTPVTTFATTAVSTDVPILIAPAMHQSMLDQPIISEKIDYLKKHGVKFIDPKIEKNKAKMAGIEEIVFETKKQLNPSNLKNKKILVTAGATYTEVDGMRILTNKSTGETGLKIAMEAAKRGADVTLIHGEIKNQKSIGVNSIKSKSYEEMKKSVMEEIDKKQYDYLISSAAISDFKPIEKKKKLDSKKKQSISLTNTEKIIKKAKKKSPETKIISFKLEINEEKINEKTKNLLNHSELVIGNKIGDLGKEKKDYYILGKEKEEKNKLTKTELAKYISDLIKKNEG